MLPAHYNKKETSYFCRFTFGQFFTLLLLEIFTLFFIFYLGAHYGGELLGIKSQAPVDASTGGLPKVISTDTAIVTTTRDPEIKELARDLLKSAPTPDLKQRVADMLQESAAKKGTPSVAPENPAALRAAPRESPAPAVVTAPQPVITAPKKPAPIIQTVPENARYSVQVGSYPNSDEAYAVIDQWKGKGYPAFLVSADIPNKGRWYRVRLGGFDSKEKAQTYLTKLQSSENVEGFVVTNE